MSCKNMYLLIWILYIFTDSISLSRNVLDRKGDIVEVNEGKFSFYIKEALKEVFGQVLNYVYTYIMYLVL